MEATLINISISNGDLLCHRIMFPAAPNRQGFNYVTDSSQILYAFVLLNMGYKSQTALLEHLETGKHFIFV